MTNTTYFYNTLREYYDSSSVSSSSVGESCSDHQMSLQHGGQGVVKVEAATSSLYSAIGKACLACARPPIQLEQEDDDTTTTRSTVFSAINQENTKTDEEESTQTLSSEFVYPTPHCSTVKRFDFTELKTATGNFRPSAALKGSLSSVYKGWIDEHELTATKLGMGIPISVKVLNSGGFQDRAKWLEEVIYLGRLHHPNILRLLGYCLEDTKRLLVYEFTSRGSLENLFEGPSPKVPWSLWLNVALDAAKGLAFIHSSNIVHGYFKPSNILLDRNYNAKLLGFGLTKESPTTFPKGVVETPFGDFGYDIDRDTIHDAPEYLYTGHFSAKSDVYSFGVVFVQILFGRRAFEKFWPLEEQNLVEWIKSQPNRKPRFVNVLDSCSKRQLRSGENAVQLAIQCLSVEVKLRPTMDNIVKELEELVNENNWRDAQNDQTQVT